MTDDFDRLITVLDQELKLTGTEIAEILWLAMQRQPHLSRETQITSSGEEAATSANQDEINVPQPKLGIEETTKTEDKTTLSGTSSSIKPQPQVSTTPPSVSKPTSAAKVYPKTIATSLNQGYLTMKVPGASSLRNSLNIAIALRPLIRYISAGKAVLLDEEATVELIAELEGICIPKLKPPLELQFDLALVVDESDSMIFWRETTQELQQLFKHYGIFRNLQTWGMVTDEKGNIRLRQGIGKKNSRYLYLPQKLIDPSGRRLILVVSDCVGEIWRNGKAFSLLESWGKHNIVAIVQILPERMWLRTALSLGAMVQLDCFKPTVSNRNLFVKEILLWNDVDLKTGIKVPVFSLEPDLVETWSEMVVKKGDIGAGGFVFSVSSKQEQMQFIEDADREILTSEERVYNFQMSSSQIAQNLAKLLAASPVINLPIVRSIQKTLLRQSQQSHVAEVFLGGILKPQSLITPDTNPDEVQYHFIDEKIRDILIQESPRMDSKEIITAISKDFAKRLGKSLKEFYALLKKPDDLEKQIQEKGIKNFDVIHFAEVTTKVLKRLGGAYARFAEEIEENLRKEPEVTQQLKFETETVNASGQVIKTENHQATYYEESLGDNIPPLVMIGIPEGEFIMGSPEDEPQRYDDESPQHQVKVAPFWLAQTPITNAQWNFVANLTQIQRELNFKDSNSKDEHPVNEVSWYDAMEFCARLSRYTGRDYRLPSEAEWEYACRSVNSEDLTLEEWNKKYHQPFHFGSTITSKLANYAGTETYADESPGEYREKTISVKSFSPNVFGLYDMHGQVLEWCADPWHENYQNAPEDSQVWDEHYNNNNRYQKIAGYLAYLLKDERMRILRGGSWNYFPRLCRSAFRGWNVPDFTFYACGFRVAHGTPGTYTPRT